MQKSRKGLIEHDNFLVLDNVPAPRNATLDMLTVQFHQRHRQTFRSRYPATDFSRLGLVPLFVFLSQSDKGCDILDHKIRRKSTMTSAVDVQESSAS